MSNPVISIVIPCYNAERYCGQLLYTIDTQLIGGGGKIEFLLVNDGSKDNTLARLNELQKRFPDNVKVINKPNGGVSSARNLGIQEANGEWIGFLDSDDVYAPGALQYLLDHCVSDDIEVLQFEYKTVSKCPNTYAELTSNLTYEGDAQEYYAQMKALTVWRFLYRRTYIIKNNIQFRDLRIGEDGLFNFDICMAGGRIRCVDTVVTYYISHAGSLTTSTNSQYVRTIISSVMVAQRTFSDYVRSNQVSHALNNRILLHQERQIRFVFSKICATSDFSISEIQETVRQFREYCAFPLRASSRKDSLINYLFNHPRVFRMYILSYSTLKRLKHFLH